jgi:CHRD domain
MNSRRLAAVAVLAVFGALLLALPASGVTPASGTTDGGGPLATLKASLTGEKEVPGPGDDDGSGSAVVKVFRAKVCYTLKVARIEPATAAHIHLGFRDEAGPVVATLEPPTDGSSSACTQIPRALSLGLREHPGRYYVNVHNEPFPDGAVRGQLSRR